MRLTTKARSAQSIEDIIFHKFPLITLFIPFLIFETLKLINKASLNKLQLYNYTVID